jgi:hypothetical protein
MQADPQGEPISAKFVPPAAEVMPLAGKAIRQPARRRRWLFEVALDVGRAAS